MIINGLHLYSAFTDPVATKALYILPHIHPFTHSFIISIFSGSHGFMEPRVRSQSFLCCLAPGLQP